MTSESETGDRVTEPGLPEPDPTEPGLTEPDLPTGRRYEASEDPQITRADDALHEAHDAAAKESRTRIEEGTNPPPAREAIDDNDTFDA